MGNSWNMTRFYGIPLGTHKELDEHFVAQGSELCEVLGEVTPGVELEEFGDLCMGSDANPCYLLIVASVESLGGRATSPPTVRPDWDAKLSAALTALQLTSNNTPAWFNESWYG